MLSNTFQIGKKGTLMFILIEQAHVLVGALLSHRQGSAFNALNVLFVHHNIILSTR